MRGSKGTIFFKNINLTECRTARCEIFLIWESGSVVITRTLEAVRPGFLSQATNLLWLFAEKVCLFLYATPQDTFLLKFSSPTHQKCYWSRPWSDLLTSFNSNLSSTKRTWLGLIQGIKIIRKCFLLSRVRKRRGGHEIHFTNYHITVKITCVTQRIWSLNVTLSFRRAFG